jgi:predicted KAP-like P-loop ATPase
MAKSVKRKTKKLILGDDAIESSDADWLGFKISATELAKQLYEISKSSGVCCGILGRWGSGKSSFMKLMNEYIRKESGWKKVHIVWFTAWGPGGIQDLGDAMLYRFFQEVAGKRRETKGAFRELQVALRIRRSLKERIRQAIRDTSTALPPAPQAAATAVSGLIEELDAPLKVQRSFEKLMDWLEKEDRAVFFFIDDLCRATGEQIRDLLSELKLYISHRRIVAVLAYDEDYVLSALKPPVLPQGIDPKKYLEKIITIKRNVPVPRFDDVRIYAEHLIRSVSNLKKNEPEVAFHAAVSLATIRVD